jgi:nucleotidyltransferase substrate binding protein (TIGR01987 family)
MSKISLDRLEKALGKLKQGYKLNPTELERDGLIQRFEYSVELCWKTSKKVLFNSGIQVDSPKNVIRELAQLDWIDNPQDWINYIDKRNETSHIYNEEVANRIFSVIEKFIVDSEKLLERLREKINE